MPVTHTSFSSAISATVPPPPPMRVVDLWLALGWLVCRVENIWLARVEFALDAANNPVAGVSAHHTLKRLYEKAIRLALRVMLAREVKRHWFRRCKHRAALARPRLQLVSF